MNDFDRLSQIQTLWSVVRRAHGDESQEIRTAQRELWDRYGGAAKRYLLGALRDEDAANEVYQEFALRFVKGAFRRADPAKGRFRSFLKTSLHHLIVDLHKQQKRRGAMEELAEPAGPDEAERRDRAFAESWRDELLARAWKALSAEQQRSGKPLYTVLRFRAEHPQMRSAEMAPELSTRLQREITTANVRVMLHRARERFADLLLEEVAHSLDDAARDVVEEELADLDLLEYCAPALMRRDVSAES